MDSKKLVFHVFTALAEFMRERIHERTQSGLMAAWPETSLFGIRHDAVLEMMRVHAAWEEGRYHPHPNPRQVLPLSHRQRR